MFKKGKIIGIILVFSLIANIFGLNLIDTQQKTTASPIFGENYADTVELWSKQMQYTNTGELATTEASVTPGDEVEAEILEGYPESELADITVLQYYYEGSNYAYGIDGSGNETIALRKPNGVKIDMLDGAGKFVLKSESKATLLSNTVVSSFTEGTDENGIDYVDVKYTLSGSAAANSKITARYLFTETGINVTYNVIGSSNVAFASNRSYLARTYSNGYKSDEVRVNSKWVYPDSMDYPYQDFESLVYIDDIDGAHRMYSFLREEGMNTYWVVYEQNGTHMPVFFDPENTTYIDYEYSYDIAMVDVANEEQNPDYLGLFRGMHSDFAVGIAPTVDTDRSSVFVGDSAKLNINVTNLKNKDLTFSLRYDIRDYYGTVVDSGLFTDNKVLAGLDVNRNITVTGAYGMYYLNLYVVSENSTYSECYPFAILEDYTYQYNETSPFGMATGAHGKKVQTRIDTARLYAKMGVTNSRIGGLNEQVQEMINLGITRFNGAYGPVNDNADNVESYVTKVLASLDNMINIVDSMEVGNEMSLEASKEGGRPLEQLYPLFYNYTYQPTLKAIKEKYPNLPYIPTPFSACEQAWINMFSEGYVDANGDGIADSDENGKLLTNSENESWSEVEIVSTHIYGTPYMPDAYAQRNPTFGGDMWVIESGMQRMQNMFENHRSLRGGKEDPLFYLTEVGYNTAPASDATICLRTQADYTARIGVICAAYGVDRIQYYCMYDRTSYYSGFKNEDKEWNFGLCYEPDYYEVIKPKPAMVAFAAMTRQLESMNTSTAAVCDKYDEGWNVGGVRAFEFDTELHGTVVAAYSNAEVLTNGKKDVNGNGGYRTPTLPWNNQWTETDKTVFDAVGDKVTVVDVMGNETEYMAENGQVTIPLTGSLVYIYGVDTN